MANNRGRRKRRRKRQAASRGTTPKLPSLTPAITPIPFWKRIPAAVYLGLGALALLITLLEGYPWLSIEESGLLDPTNPYSQMFKVTNGGYIPVTDLDAICNASGSLAGDKFKDFKFHFGPFAYYLGHGGTVTCPCFKMFNLGKEEASAPEGNTLRITITYDFFHFNWEPTRRSQTFRFKSVVGRDNSQHWIFIG